MIQRLHFLNFGGGGKYDPPGMQGSEHPELLHPTNLVTEAFSLFFPSFPFPWGLPPAAHTQRPHPVILEVWLQGNLAQRWCWDPGWRDILGLRVQGLQNNEAQTQETQDHGFRTAAVLSAIGGGRCLHCPTHRNYLWTRWCHALLGADPSFAKSRTGEQIIT